MKDAYALLIIFLGSAGIALASEDQALIHQQETINKTTEAQLLVDQQTLNQQLESKLQVGYQSGIQKQEQQLLEDERKRKQVLQESLN